MARSRKALAAAIACASACLLPTVAHAAPLGSQANPLPAPGGLEVHGSHGYTLTIQAQPAYRGRPSSVFISADKPGSLVLYETQAEIEDRKIVADLGPLGRIDLRYEPSGQVRSQRSRCRTEKNRTPIHFEGGAYTGTIEFKGEEGFTEASATRVEGDLGWRLGCPVGVKEKNSRTGILLDTVTKRQKNGGVAFSAIRNKPRGEVIFNARMVEQVGAMQILREVLLHSRTGRLSVSSSLGSASVRPPAPFAGRATFKRQGKSWRGNLAVDFPGHADVRLAGSAFRAELRHGVREFGRRS